mgnify:CR=1 FL=1
MNYVYLKNTPNFTIKSYKNKTWKKWDAENKKMLSSETWQKDYKPMYQFVVENDDVLEISRDQLGQCLIAAFEVQKPLSGLSFSATDNGKQGLDKRWWINLKRLENPTSVQPTSVQPTSVQPTSVQPNAEEVNDLNPLF